MWDKDEFPEGTKVRFRADTDWGKRYTHGVVDSNCEMGNEHAYIPIRIVGYTERGEEMFLKKGIKVHGGFFQRDVEKMPDPEFEKLEAERLGERYEPPRSTIEI